jgi:CO dehydrogenase maturation factor
MPKILICGKGGSGKSTITTLIANNLKTTGHRILIVDTDESNYGLSIQLGLNDPKELLDQIGGKKAILQKMFLARGTGEKATLFTENCHIDGIPADCVSKKDNLYLLQIGKVKHYGEGCACPMGGLARDFLKHLQLDAQDVVLIDTEAGVEHLGRGMVSEVDLVLAILDPSYESIKLSKKITDMAKEAGKNVYFILNKVDEATAEKIATQVGKQQVIGFIPFNTPIQEKGLNGEVLNLELSPIAQITSFLLNISKKEPN